MPRATALKLRASGPIPVQMGLSFLRRSHTDERVVVHVGGLPPFEAIVARAVDGAAELALASAPAAPTRYLHRCPARVRPVEGEGVRIGTLLAVPGRRGRVREDLLHFVHVGAAPAAAPATAAQRREFVRVDAIRPVTVVPERFRVGWLEGTTRNLSAGGALLSGVERLREGERLRLRLELERDDLLDVFGRLVRVRDDGLGAVRMEGLGEAERDHVVRWVREQELRALAQLRDLER